MNIILHISLKGDRTNVKYINSPDSMSTSKNPNNNNEADIIFNRANVALARSQRLVASWLPPKTQEEEEEEKSSKGKSEAELQRLEDEMFTPVPERLGLGAPIPKQGINNTDKIWNPTELSSNDKLRQQLLGRNFKKLQEQKQLATAKNRMTAGATAKSGPSNNSTTAHERNNNDEDEDEEEGRSSLGKSKKQPKAKKGSSLPVVPANVNIEAESEKGNADEPSTEESVAKKSKTTATSKRKGTGSFLDDLLSDRKKKRKKQK